MNASARDVRYAFSVGCVVSGGGFAQQSGRGRQLALVLDRVRHRDERSPPGARRMVVKNPVACVRASPLSESIHFWTSSLVAPAG